MRSDMTPHRRYNIIFERFKTHDITDERELAYFFGVDFAEKGALNEKAPPESDARSSASKASLSRRRRVTGLEPRWRATRS